MVGREGRRLQGLGRLGGDAVEEGDTAFDGPQFGEELSLPEPFPVPLKTA